MNITSKSIAIIAAHPDDETLGMGGTIKLLTAKGNKVSVLFLTDGVGARDNFRENAESRKQSCISALKVLGCESYKFGNFPDNALDSVPRISIIKFIENFLVTSKADVVFTHFPKDLNIDHQIAASSTLVACRPKLDSLVNSLYFFEVASSTGWNFGEATFDPRIFIDVDSTMTSKIQALMEYSVELDDFPNARSILAIEALAKVRGSSAGMKNSEAFEVGFIRNGIN
jgi:LmbE family N-acetylglucosaminyl deacetylase